MRSVEAKSRGQMGQPWRGDGNEDAASVDGALPFSPRSGHVKNSEVRPDGRPSDRAHLDRYDR
jgi:hypothetical protein